MAKTKTLFVAEDGKEFDTESAADAHDRYLSNQTVIENYITSAGLKAAQAGLMRKHLPAFLNFRSVVTSDPVPAEA